MTKTTLRTYRIPLIFPLGAAGSPNKRRLLELAAKDRLRADLLSDGYKMVEETFRVSWETDACHGYAYASGLGSNNGSKV